MNYIHLCKERRRVRSYVALGLSCLLAMACEYRPHVAIPGCSPEISPGGSRVVFAAPGVDNSADIYMVNVDGKGLRRIISHAAQDYGGQWSYEGDAIYFISERGRRPNIFRSNLDGSAAHAVTAQRRVIGAIVPSPGGKRLAYAESVGDTRNLMIFETKQYRKLQVHGVYPSPIDWLDTDTLAYDCSADDDGSWRNQIRSISLRDGRDELLWQQRKEDAYYLIISRDKSRAAWIEVENYKTYRLFAEDLASGDRKVLLQGQEKLWDLAISNDGRFVVVLRGVIEAPPVNRGILCIIEVDTGKVSTLVDTRKSLEISH